MGNISVRESVTHNRQGDAFNVWIPRGRPFSLTRGEMC